MRIHNTRQFQIDSQPVESLICNMYSVSEFWIKVAWHILLTPKLCLIRKEKSVINSNRALDLQTAKGSNELEDSGNCSLNLNQTCLEQSMIFTRFRLCNQKRLAVALFFGISGNWQRISGNWQLCILQRCSELANKGLFAASRNIVEGLTVGFIFRTKYIRHGLTKSLSILFITLNRLP